MLEQEAINLLDKVGVAVAAFVMMYALYVQNQKWQQKQQVNTEIRFDKLVENFVKTMRDIADSGNAAIKANTEAIERNTSKLEEHIRLKDEFIEYIKQERRGYD